MGEHTPGALRAGDEERAKEMNESAVEDGLRVWIDDENFTMEPIMRERRDQNVTHQAARTLSVACSAIMMLASGCADDGGAEPQGVVSGSCTPDQPAPYANGIPYLGIHADPGNSDVIGCRTADAFEQSYHALEGMGLTQPNTFSPDGAVTYATTTNPLPEGCRLHALDAATGQERWCRSYPPSIGQSAVEVDRSGRLYFSVESAIVSLNADGEDLWQTDFETEGAADPPWGVHFTPDGHIATVTSSGVIYLLERETGAVLASLSIPQTWGFVAPEALDLPIDLTSVLPEEVQGDILEVWGESTDEEAGSAFAGFLGAGSFVDNTLAISPRGHIYVVGGGQDVNHGALVQVLVSGPAQTPTLSPGWVAHTVGGSASSPSVNRTNTHVVIADGSSTQNLLSPGSVPAKVRVADIAKCDANTDADPDESVCAFDFEQEVERSALPGAPAILDDGAVVFYEFGLDFSAAPEDRDVVMLGPDGVRWETALPGDLDWNSVVTVTDNHIIGTASLVELSDQKLLGLAFPTRTDDKLVILDREDGQLVFQADVPDDSSATVTIGPDGSLYVGVLGLLSILSIDDRPDLGLIRFKPRRL